MSEQNKSNLQALGAGVLGFVVVVAIGGGALMVRSSQQSKASAKPVPAAEPIDLGASMPRSSPGFARKAAGAESPAPLIGEEDEAEAAHGVADGSGASAPSAAAALGAASQPGAAAGETASARGLAVKQHLDGPGNGTSATAVVKNIPADKKGAKPAVKKPAVSKLESPSGAAPAAVASSVHYGVTSRNELMGRAAGPVYNFKGAGKGAQAQGGKLGGEAATKISDIQKQLDDAGLPAEQREQLKKELDAATKGLDDPEKPAQ